MELFKRIFRRKTKYEKRYESIGRLVAVELMRNRAFRREVERLPLGQQIINICNGKDDNR